MYSTANERGFDRNRFIGCLSATCRRDARDPLVSPAFQDRRRNACEPAQFFVTKKLSHLSLMFHLSLKNRQYVIY
ncbi:MAG: hypothetical protein LBP59_09400 [Planctomycetaceae bacterium]|nr:hypothetical protein [Planctomycetaceae bacterium]